MNDVAENNAEEAVQSYGFNRWHVVVVIWVFTMFALPPLKGGFTAKAMLLPLVGPYCVFFQDTPNPVSPVAMNMIAAGTTLLVLGALLQTSLLPIRLNKDIRLTIWFFTLCAWCTAGYMAAISMMG